MSPWGFDEIRRDPADCCRRLVATGAVSSVQLDVVQHNRILTTLEARFESPPGLEDFPEEVARTSVLYDRTVVTVPVGDPDRTWSHRYPAMTADEIRIHLSGTEKPAWLHVFGALCLEFPKDPWWLRWSWCRGLDTYLQMVQRHLLAEECARRFGDWPVEDAPHGYRADGKPHPIMSTVFQAAS